MYEVALLTTLVLPKDQPQPANLWQKLWLNVLPKMRLQLVVKADYDKNEYDTPSMVEAH